VLAELEACQLRIVTCVSHFNDVVELMVTQLRLTIAPRCFVMTDGIRGSSQQAGSIAITYPRVTVCEDTGCDKKQQEREISSQGSEVEK
jgi:hypothetical protein